MRNLYKFLPYARRTQKQADALLAQPRPAQNLVEKVRLLLSSRIGQPDLTAEGVANTLNMSVRKLHRLLSNEGTSFRVLRRDVLQSAAREALSFTDASVSEIAVKLGYSEISAFNRAFKREEGVSPLQYRKKAKD